MAGNGNKWLELLELAGNGRKWLKVGLPTVFGSWGLGIIEIGGFPIGSGTTRSPGIVLMVIAVNNFYCKVLGRYYTWLTL